MAGYIDPEAIRRAYTRRTRAVVVVHYAGIACAIDEITHRPFGIVCETHPAELCQCPHRERAPIDALVLVGYGAAGRQRRRPQRDAARPRQGRDRLVEPVEVERRAAYSFASLSDGFEACRRVMRNGATPAVLRLYDGAESKRSHGGDGTEAVLLVLDEGNETIVDATMSVTHDACMSMGARVLGTEIGRAHV